MKAVLDLPETHAQVLILLLDIISPEKHKWVLTGSAGLRLQGVDLTVNDLDLQTDGEDVYVIEKKLGKFMKVGVHRWESEHIISLHGQAVINGIMVELLGNMQHRQPGGMWEPPVDILSTRIWVTWSEHKIPVFPLEFEAQAYSKMGRTEKAKIIREAIRS
jgi:hypothetical protein